MKTNKTNKKQEKGGHCSIMSLYIFIISCVIVISFKRQTFIDRPILLNRVVSLAV